MLELRKYGWIVGLSLMLGCYLSACKDVSNQIGNDKKVQNDEEIRAYLAANNITAQSTKEGLYYKVVSKGASGQKAVVGDEIKVSYIARRLDGVLVDSSQLRLNIPSRAIYSISRLPYLSDEAMALVFGTPLLAEGDSATLLVPSHLVQRPAGIDGNLLFPAYTPLRVDLKVVSINTEAEQIDAFIREQGIFISETTESGLRFGKTVSKPDSVLLKTGDKASVKYTGRLLNNTIFDSGTITETIGSSSSVKGFAEGIAKMRVGEKANLIFPSSLGYGAPGRPEAGIPGLSALYFEVEVLSKTQ
ncbi:FKBP-type peptidyl-prolyl cis-trans isomerase [Persicitalea jodogahamensis]|uniref:Peptidyl-prolyl cis-trans isomerase n=1 Tax=Persicitalea jodogahamensis TaxID=402147 RepID=A0A8J3GAS0_9BACT|nr:FKBP-type peptidyl-prolyl cis-trans isomerase [Persicitalea jodogahamensis]GHB76801.1 hypothetical protein GCM10007390_33470 [Persicitalea jodogahamensis]